MTNTKVVRVSKSHRICIPKAVRDAAGWLPGQILDVDYRDGKIFLRATGEIEPASAPMSKNRERKP